MKRNELITSKLNQKKGKSLSNKKQRELIASIKVNVGSRFERPKTLRNKRRDIKNKYTDYQLFNTKK